MADRKKITILDIIAKKRKSEKIVCLTAYDWLLARLLDQAGVDIILVGDSAGNVLHGYKNTLPVTMDQMIDHTSAVTRGVSHALVVGDMPFLSYQASTEQALQNAGRFLKEGSAEAVKLEGGEPIAETVRRLVSVGIPVMGHLGLTPQSIQQFGGYRVRGKSSGEADELKKAAQILEEAGVFSIVLEKVPSDLAKEIKDSISIPTIGIGAGPDCDGQVLVTHDLLGMFQEFKPRFVRRYGNLAETIEKAVKAFAKDVRTNQFPSKDESF